jgi:hypothetical protein
MPDSSYDPEKTPDPQRWQALDEHERIRLAKNYHERTRVKLPNVKLHAAMHVVVENQLAIGYEPSCRAIERLQKQGLSRHDAVHAIGSLVAQFIYEVSTAGSHAQADLQSRLSAAIERLSAEEWIAMDREADR